MGTTRSYDRESFLDEFFPEADERAEVVADAQRLVNQSRAHRLAEMRRRLGLTQAEVAERMHVRQEKVSAIDVRRSTSASCGPCRRASEPWVAAWR